MSNRRDFLKVSLAAVAGMSVSKLPFASAESGLFPKGLIYTKDNPGKWSKKVKSHAPVVKIEPNKITIETKHPMTEQHYIVRHTLVSQSGEVLGEKTFYPSDKKAMSVFDMPAGHLVLYATSFCNKHDFWVTEFKI